MEQPLVSEKENSLGVRYLANVAESVEALGADTRQDRPQLMIERRGHRSLDQVRRDRPPLSWLSSEHGDSGVPAVERDLRAL